MKEERKKNKPEDGSDMLSWVSKIRKIETKKNVEKQKARQMSKHLEEQVSASVRDFFLVSIY